MAAATQFGGHPPERKEVSGQIFRDDCDMCHRITRTSALRSG
jgi:hypothetical protein